MNTKTNPTQMMVGIDTLKTSSFMHNITPAVDNTTVRRLTELFTSVLPKGNDKWTKRMLRLADAMMIEPKRSLSKWVEKGYFNVDVANVIRFMRRFRDAYASVRDRIFDRIMEHMPNRIIRVQVNGDCFMIERKDSQSYAVRGGWSGQRGKATKGITIVDVWVSINGYKFPYDFRVCEGGKKRTELGREILAEAVKKLTSEGFQEGRIYVSGDAGFTNETVVQPLREQVEAPVFVGHVKLDHKARYPGKREWDEVEVLCRRKRKRIQKRREQMTGRGRRPKAVKYVTWEGNQVEYMTLGPLLVSGLGRCKVFAFRFTGGETEDPLMACPGIGEKTRQRLLERFGSVEEIRQVGVEELTNVEGIGKARAIALHRYLTSARQDPDDPDEGGWKYYVTTKEDMCVQTMLREIKKRWPVEVGHRDLRQFCGCDRFFLRTEESTVSYLCLSYVLAGVLHLYKVKYGDERSTEALRDEIRRYLRPLRSDRVARQGAYGIMCQHGGQKTGDTTREDAKEDSGDTEVSSEVSFPGSGYTMPKIGAPLLDLLYGHPVSLDYWRFSLSMLGFWCRAWRTCPLVISAARQPVPLVWRESHLPPPKRSYKGSTWTRIPHHVPTVAGGLQKREKRRKRIFEIIKKMQN